MFAVLHLTVMSLDASIFGLSMREHLYSPEVLRETSVMVYVSAFSTFTVFPFEDNRAAAAD